ncbi:MAG TPA: hypothetical protein DCP90_04975 [Clostridiales bacterium]|nr:MAG: hypothetical protein A2Y22_06290 [Clostridiales bacterium GWD2_32_59]HAN09951.1 hypothetical protein [Clostridiales bacterium]
MKIKKIELVNIKRYDTITIELSDGVNFISGKNGAGKTTIIESIGFALFDYKISKQNFDQYFIRKGEKKGQVRIEFLDKNGEEYIVDRKISTSGASNSWAIKKSDETCEIAIVSKDDEVRAWLKDHLEFYPDDNISDIYTNIVSVPQGEFTVAFLESEKARKSIFDPIFNLESYRRAYENVQLERGITSDIRKIENEINVKIGETKKLDELVIECENIKNLCKSEKEVYLLTKKDFEQVKLEYETLDKQKQVHQKLENDKRINEVQIEKLVGYIKQKNVDIDSSKKAMNILRENEDKYNEYLKVELEKKACEEIYKEFLILKETLIQTDERIEAGNSKINEREKFIGEERQELLTKKQELVKQNDAKESLKGALILKTEELAKTEQEISLMKSNVEYVSENIIKMQHLKKDVLKLIRNFETPKRELKRLEDIKSAAKIIEIDENANEIIHINVNIINTKANELILGKTAETKDSDEQLKNVTEQIEKLKESILLKMSIAEDSQNRDEEEIYGKYKSRYEVLSKKYVNESLQYERQKAELAQKEMQLTKDKEEYLIKQTKIKESEEEKNKWVSALDKLKHDKQQRTSSTEKYKDIEIKVAENDKKITSLKPIYELYILNRIEASKYEKQVADYKSFEADKAEKDIIMKKLVLDTEELSKSFDKDKYESAKVNHEIVKQEVIKAEEQLKVLEQQYNKCTIEIEYLKQVRQTIKESQTQIKKLEKINEVIKKIRNIIKGAPEHIAEVLIKKISTKASHIYTKIAIDSSKLEWEKNYEIALYDILNGAEIRKEFKQLSGGEQITAALSIRIALLELMTKLGIGILDEPTINMDTSRRERLAEVIESVGTNFRQLIIVSHDDTFQSVTENVIMLN